MLPPGSAPRFLVVFSDKWSPWPRGMESAKVLLTLLTSTAAIPNGSESRKALLQEYLNKSKKNKENNDKERLDDYYRRNYRDYFGLIEGSARQKKEDELTESEKRIIEWLDKNS